MNHNNKRAGEMREAAKRQNESTLQLSVDNCCGRRDKAIASLLSTLRHLSRETQYSILTSYLTIEELEACAEYQRGYAERVAKDRRR